jgi:tRNA pseudouridine55 synthase
MTRSLEAPAVDEAPPAVDARARERAGLLIVDKPGGITSHDVVARVRRALRMKGVGHLGTLDPAATGLLIVAVGAATRCASVWQGGEKTYLGTARFGLVTSTQDLSGEVLDARAVELDEDRIRAASATLTGEIEQVPPMVSALKIQGERLYRLARRGVTVDRAPRRITVFEWEWLAFELPDARFRVRCSTGTYVRTLVHELGAKLGAGAALASLRRIRSEPFGLARCVHADELARLSPGDLWARGGIELEAALATLSSVMLDAGGTAAIARGAPADLGAPHARGAWPPIQEGPRSVVFHSTRGVALALGEIRRDGEGGERLFAHPHVVFPWAVRGGYR